MQKTKTLLVWPWKASRLEYHAMLDTFINGEFPSEQRSILPDSCFPDINDVVKPPEPSVELRKNISAGTTVDCVSDLSKEATQWT